MAPLLLTIPDASIQLGIPESTLRRCERAGDIKAAKIGNCTYIPRDELRHFVRRMMEQRAAWRQAAVMAN